MFYFFISPESTTTVQFLYSNLTKHFTHLYINHLIFQSIWSLKLKVIRYSWVFFRGVERLLHCTNWALLLLLFNKFKDLFFWILHTVVYNFLYSFCVRPFVFQLFLSEYFVFPRRTFNLNIIFYFGKHLSYRRTFL